MGRSDRKTKREYEPEDKKKAHIAEKPGSYFDLPPGFSFGKYDEDMPWSSSPKPTVDSIMKILQAVEKQKWKDVIQASGGRAHGTNSHLVRIVDLSAEAKKRAAYLELNESELFSLRLQGDVRLWGVIKPDDGKFYVIWYDPNHKVYPVKK
jgi:hypothetical protein